MVIVCKQPDLLSLAGNGLSDRASTKSDEIDISKSLNYICQDKVDEVSMVLKVKSGTTWPNNTVKK